MPTYVYMYTMCHVDVFYVCSESNKAFQIAVRMPGVLVQNLARVHVELRKTVGRKRNSANPLAFKTVVLFRTPVFI